MKRFLITTIILISSFTNSETTSFNKNNINNSEKINYLIEYNTKTEKIKIISRKTRTNKCDEDLKKSKELIKKEIGNRIGKIKLSFTCYK